MTYSKNHEEDFFKLNIGVLRTQAKRWVKRFSEEPIKHILLYSFSSEWERHFNSDSHIPVIYAVVFEVDADDKEIEECRHARKIGQRSLFPGERLQDATREHNVVPDKKPNRNFINADFSRVYKQDTPSNVREEWIFRVKFNNRDLNSSIRTDESRVVLWEQNTCDLNAPAKAVRESTFTKNQVQLIAGGIWQSHPDLLIKFMKEHPLIKDLANAYSGEKTLHQWLAEVAPDKVRKKGRISKDATEKQHDLCRQLGIKFSK